MLDLHWLEFSQVRGKVKLQKVPSNRGNGSLNVLAPSVGKDGGEESGDGRSDASSELWNQNSRKTIGCSS